MHGAGVQRERPKAALPVRRATSPSIDFLWSFHRFKNNTIWSYDPKHVIQHIRPQVPRPSVSGTVASGGKGGAPAPYVTGAPHINTLGLGGSAPHSVGVQVDI